ncbi:MAG TPA: hypothetical protein DFS52_13570 [Myxococcales bacterium]|nr:hypothetical protein [Myxococcales bacterium]
MIRHLSIAALALFATACAAGRSMAPHPSYEPTAEGAAPQPLDRSLFAPRGSSGLTEADIARILDAPIALELPARVGVAALAEPFQPHAPARIETGFAATRALGEALEGTKLVSVTTDVVTRMPSGAGIEGLRELAARYRTPYLLLYTEDFEDRSHANGWSTLWITVIGGLLSPSRTLAAEGLLQASLFDVRTGTILFTVQERVGFTRKHLPIGASGAYEELLRKSADEATKTLADRVVAKLQRIARDATGEDERVALRLGGGKKPSGIVVPELGIAQGAGADSVLGDAL